MSRAGRILFIVGIVIALGSGFFVFVLLWLSQARPTNVESTKLVIAFQNIPARTEIMPDQIGVANWPVALPTPIGAYEDPTKVMGKLATSPIVPGQPIVAQGIVDKAILKDTRSNAAFIVEKGSVGVAMPVTVKSSIADAIQPGDHVDVIATFTSRGQTGQVATNRLLVDMLVLQVGLWPRATTNSGQQAAATNTSVITLQLKEQDVLVLEYAEQFANEVTLVLRPANDNEIVPLEPVTFDYINQRFGYKLAK